MQTSGSPTRFEFGRHETFPVRHGWLAKGLGRVRKTGRYDGDLETADALGLACIIHEGPDSTAKGRDRRRNGSRTSSPASGAGVEQPTGGA